MELLSPSLPPSVPPAGFSVHVVGFDCSTRTTATSSQPLAISGGGEKIHVAVGKSVEKTVGLINWTSQRFQNREICLLHVHQPSPLIPTLLGKLPASQANGEVVTAYRREEREQTKKLILNYMSICYRMKVKVRFIITEADQVQKGIVDLVNSHGIRRLVMGAVPENCMKVKKGSSKANYAAKRAPLFCEIWFVNKGRHVWTREASEDPTLMPPISQPENASHETLQYHANKHIFHQEFLHSNSSTILHVGRSQVIASQTETTPSALSSAAHNFDEHSFHGSFSPPRASTASGYTSSAERGASSDCDLKVEEESLHSQLIQARMQAEASAEDALAKLLKCKKLEAEAMEAISKVKALEAAHAHELGLRKEAEEVLRTTVQEQEQLLEEREEINRKIQRTMRNIALLDSRAQEANRRRDEAAAELKLIQSSISTMRQEKKKIQRQKTEAMNWLERWRSRGQTVPPNCSGLIGLIDDFPELAEFSLSDLQTATCDFSESFKIGQGGYGSVYKGELFDKTVAIKKLHAHNMHGQSEFQQEVSSFPSSQVQVLGKLHHPHLVTLLGTCPEAWALVYEYMPNGSLQDRLFKKSNIAPLPWKIRACIISEIASALLFLHSSRPEKIIHGDLKLENVLLDAELSCKICDFGICRLVPEENFNCRSFHRNTEPMGAFQYTDPEFYRTGILSPKSDVYSLGLIILQVLTGRPPVGLVSEVRRAVSCGKLASVLDSSAGDWPSFVSRRLVDLGLQCCELNSRDRPELTPTLVRELEQLHVSEERPVPSFFLCPILQEIMHDPQVAADGFTYEGEALRGWFANGHDTSPMTNLKLSHLDLTPNHALRLAIQEWVCQS
ncbi:Protein kinase domain [Dillenia turbinata]|uniref:RING-type E3 ubiquitin transferase n=1 Tax=Dillenia turbinata TaxID=194707 RepID=A0AAN8VBC7_9MAGN